MHTNSTGQQHNRIILAYFKWWFVYKYTFLIIHAIKVHSSVSQNDFIIPCLRPAYGMQSKILCCCEMKDFIWTQWTSIYTPTPLVLIISALLLTMGFVVVQANEQILNNSSTNVNVQFYLKKWNDDVVEWCSIGCNSWNPPTQWNWLNPLPNCALVTTYWDHVKWYFPTLEILFHFLQFSFVAVLSFISTLLFHLF